MMRPFLIVVFALCLSVSAFAQSFPFDIFKLRTLKEITAITTEAVRPDDSMFLATNQLESKIVVTFTGKSRPLSSANRIFIAMWAGMLGHPKEYADLYQQEYLYKEGDEYWLPTEEPITKYFPQELKAGDQIALYLISIGAHRSQKNVYCVFLVEEYQKVKAVTAQTDDGSLSSSAPTDKPFQATSEQARKLEEAIKPYVQKAKETYPTAKKRFLDGLPAKQVFFITTRLKDSEGRFEQVFIAVKEIRDGTITGRIASELQIVAGYKQGDAYSFPESELLDWTISKPDGTEEGNFVGKFLDTYQP